MRTKPAVGNSHDRMFSNRPGSGSPENVMLRRLSSSAICGSTRTVVKCWGCAGWAGRVSPDWGFAGVVPAGVA